MLFADSAARFAASSLAALRRRRERGLAFTICSVGLVVCLTAALGGSWWLADQRGWERTLYQLDGERWVSIDTGFVRDASLRQFGNAFSRNFAVRWRGEFYTLEEGIYELSGAADDALTVHIDGSVVLERSPSVGMSTERVRVRLARGRHDVSVRYEQRGGGRRLRFGWTRESSDTGRSAAVGEVFRPGPAATVRAVLPVLPAAGLGFLLGCLAFAPTRLGAVAAVAAVFVGSAMRLWLTGAQLRTALRSAIQDDFLFARLARNIVSGEWLGALDGLTLAKAPGYPLWIAANHFLPGSLRLAEELLLVVACLAAWIALRPAVGNRARALIVLGLLWAPYTFDAVRLRYVRESIYPALTLLLAAAAIGLVLRARDSQLRVCGWSAALGISGAAVWITREEGAWILPLVIGTTALTGWRRARGVRGLLRLAAPLGAGAFAFALIVLPVAQANYERYGVSALHEGTLSGITSAMGALMRIDTGRWDPRITVSRDAVRLAMEVSPTLSSIEPELAEQLRQFARPSSRWSGGAQRYEGEVLGGWFIWALRSAVGDAGHYRSGPEALAFYRRVANEIDVACGRGALACTASRASAFPSPRWEDLRGVTASAGRGAAALLTQRGIGFLPRPSQGDRMARQWFQELTGDDLMPTTAQERPVPGQWRIDAIALTAGCWRLLFLFLLATTVLVVPLRWWRAERRWPPMIGLGLCLLATVAGRVAMLAYIDVRLFPAMSMGYLSPAPPLLLLSAACLLAATFREQRLHEDAEEARSEAPECGTGDQRSR